MPTIPQGTYPGGYFHLLNGNSSHITFWAISEGGCYIPLSPNALQLLTYLSSVLVPTNVTFLAPEIAFS